MWRRWMPFERTAGRLRRTFVGRLHVMCSPSHSLAGWRWMTSDPFECETRRLPSFRPGFGEAWWPGAHEISVHGCARNMTDADIVRCAKRLLIILAHPA